MRREERGGEKEGKSTIQSGQWSYFITHHGCRPNLAVLQLVKHQAKTTCLRDLLCRIKQLSRYNPLPQETKLVGYIWDLEGT